jgi:DNA (cytosine-5)-methyltransferase 1
MNDQVGRGAPPGRGSAMAGGHGDESGCSGHPRRGTSQPVVDARLQRLLAGKPQVLDLFAGCGGMTVGFVRAGFVPVGGVEMDPDAARTYAHNFHGGDDTHGRARDITQTDPHQLLSELGLARDSVDVLVGGPPCVTFTRIGRAKLRQVMAQPQAHLADARSRLFVDYLRFVDALQPLALVMENVPDFLNQNGTNVGRQVADELEEMGYRVRYTLMNAAHYGVPQGRDRFFLVAYHQDLDEVPEIPAPTHHWDLPAGYIGGRNVALRLMRDDLIDQRDRRFVDPDRLRGGRPAVTLREAIGDLPAIELSTGRRDLAQAVAYREGEPSAYAQRMRTWPRFESTRCVTAHATRELGARKLPGRDARIFAAMAEGDEYPRAYALAEQLFAEDLAQGKTTEADRALYVPPYDPSKFPNKWRKLEWSQPARTLMAHLGKDTYTHIHPDSQQARVISVREAARLQSFPDGFEFPCAMNPAFKQIGNAVPPMLAWALAKEVYAALSEWADEAMDAPAVAAVGGR